MITEDDLKEIGFHLRSGFSDEFVLWHGSITFIVSLNAPNILYLTGEYDEDHIPVTIKDLTHLKELITLLTHES